MNEQEKILCEVLKNSIRLIDYFYEIISDGYNPAYMEFDYNLDRCFKEEELFIFKSVNRIGSKDFFINEILPTKKEIFNPDSYLKELFEWNKNHLQSFNSFPQIFTDKHRNAEFQEMLETVLIKAQLLIKNWDSRTFEYTIDSKDGSYRKFLLINESSKSVLFQLSNFIH
jgi:hypothetical protein